MVNKVKDWSRSLFSKAKSKGIKKILGLVGLVVVGLLWSKAPFVFSEEEEGGKVITPPVKPESNLIYKQRKVQGVLKDPFVLGENSGTTKGVGNGAVAGKVDSAGKVDTKEIKEGKELAEKGVKISRRTRGQFKEKPAEALQLQLTGILDLGGEQTAMIKVGERNYLVKKGDTVAGTMVQEIGRDSIKINYGTYVKQIGLE